MNAEQTATAETCLIAAHDGSLSFPEVIGKLVDASFEGYTVDYRRNSQIYYLPDGDNVELSMPHATGPVAATFDSAGVGSLVRWAQANGPAYSYASFCEKVKAAGCVGYIVSLPGRRVVYFSRTGETHVELFPQ